MLAQEVVAEVAFEFADGGVDVVPVTLEVVELDQEGGALDAVIGLFGPIEAAGPGEGELVRAGVADAGVEIRRELGAPAAEVSFHEGDEDFTLGGSHVGGGEARGRERLDAGFVSGDDLLERGVGENRDLALPFVEGVDELQAEIFFGGEDALAFAGAGADFGGVGADEGRGEEDVLAVDDREVEREVVAFEAPAPGFVGGGFAEESDEVVGGIAATGVVLLELLEEELELHDGLGFGHAGVAEAGPEEREAEGLDLGRGVAEREAFALERDEIPVFALFVGERVGDLFLLVGTQGAEESVGGGEHIAGDFVRAQSGRDEQEGKEEARGGAHG